MAGPVMLSGRQKAVFDLLCRVEHPLGAYALLDLLRADGFNSPMQVYRALHSLVEKGVVHRLQTLNAYVPCTEVDCRERGLVVFAICTTCGLPRKFADRELSMRLAEWSMRNGFQLASTVIEVHGVCDSCRPSALPQPGR